MSALAGMPVEVERLEIAERFRGPPRSGNGGYVCGRVAKYLQGSVAVRLKAPSPLLEALRLESTAEEARLFHGTTLIAEARSEQLDLQPPAPVSFDEARVASRSFLGFETHPFPGCFVCGPEREPGDGLRIFPGRVGRTTAVAAPWTPEASLADPAGRLNSEFFWSALDCTGAFALLPAPQGTAIVLGELCTSIVGDVHVGERCVLVGWPLGADGRKRLAGSALYAEDGRLIAQAKAIWIEVPLSAWL